MTTYTRKEVAQLYGVSEDTIWRWQRSGRFPNAHIERRHGRQATIIPREDLVADGILSADPEVAVTELALEPTTGLLRVELAAAKALIERQDDEIAYLRGVVEALSRRQPGEVALPDHT